MPEGDTVFRAARALDRALAGKVITRFETAYAKLASVDDNHIIAGRTVQHVEARGKWLLMFLSDDLILLTHMLMSGSWHIYRVGERWRRQRGDMRIIIETEDWIAVGFTIPVAEFHTAASLSRKKGVTALGPDLLKPEFDRQQAIEKIRAHTREEIAVVLLNQRVLAGIGNVFKSEICFASAVNPFQCVEALTQAQIEKIVDVSHKFLKLNVTEDEENLPTTNTGSRRTMNSLNRSSRLWVYGRRGEPCRRCGTPVLMRRQGAEARTTFWCPSCQPIGTAAENSPAAPDAIDGWSHRRRSRTVR
jgi:endonuclease-8